MGRRFYLAASALVWGMALRCNAATLITNGDFSASNSGFTSSYAFDSDLDDLAFVALPEPTAFALITLVASCMALRRRR